MRYTKPIVWLIFIFSGASGLIYEVIWMRQLTLIFGSTVFATSTVLTAFMAGLALGSYYFGRKIDESTQSPLRIYALLEAGIGAFCLVWPLILAALSAIYVLIHRNVTSEFLYPLTDSVRANVRSHPNSLYVDGRHAARANPVFLSKDWNSSARTSESCMH